MGLYYDYAEMERHAARIERELPELIQADNWEQITETVKVPESAWAGPAATNYQEACRKIVAARDAAAIQRTPLAIRNAIQSMQERDSAMADTIRKRFNSITGFC